MSKMTYAGLNNDKHGITTMGRVVLDGRLFGLISDTEDCAGWDLGRMQVLMDKVEREWDKYDTLPSRLPDDLRERHTQLYTQAMEAARRRGWDPELDEND